MAKVWVTCQVCQLPTTNINKLCICCWSVEAHIADYLKSDEGKRRIKQMLESENAKQELSTSNV